MDMDCTDLRKKTILLSQQDVSYFETTDTLYYDETDNIKKFKLKEDGFNVDGKIHFVLGGIEAKDTITSEELKYSLKLDVSIPELKSRYIYHGNFEDILKGRKLSSFLYLINEKGWHIHFSVLNALYFSLVDIVDSLDIRKFGLLIYDVKTLLYKCLKKEISSTTSFLYKYGYPNIKYEDIPAFCEELKNVIQTYIDTTKDYSNKLLGLILIQAISEAEKEGKLIFVQDEESLVLIKQLKDFYIQQIYSYPKARLVFDEENDVHECLQRHKVSLEGKEVTNYTMVNSENNPMVQVSDVVVGIISRYMKFLDDDIENVIQKYENFSEQQQKNFVLLNMILKRSLEHNPTFWFFTASKEQQRNMTDLMNKCLGLV